MPKQTITYKLGYFVDGEITSQITEDRRMNTIDSQMRGLYEVMGNGVLDGWQVGRSAYGSMSVDVSAGKGIITFVVVESTASSTITTLFPNATNFVFATRLPNSYWDRSVAFSISLSSTGPSDSILLAAVTTTGGGVSSINNDVRSNVGLISSIEDVVRAHKHVGGANNPDPIDLSSQVEGVVSQENLPNLDAAKVSTGILPVTVIPKIDHIAGLKNQGELTHSQLDSFVQNLSAFGKTVMGETALVNLMQLTLALKHQWPDVDEYLVNQLAFIPGISPDELVDFNNTTAEVDTKTSAEGGLHKIYGSTGPGMRTFTKTWDTAVEFEDAEKVNTTADGDSLRLEVSESSVMLDDFETIGGWETKIQDLSSSAGTLELDATTKVSGSYSAKLGINTTDASNLSFTMRKAFASQDWTKYDGIVFYLNTTSVEHGEVYFYINDAVSGVQNSYTMVLGKNEPTINRDTLLNGWREIYIDLTPFDRGSVNTVGFFLSTQHGWDATKPFPMNVDRMSLTAGNKFTGSGTARFTYGNGFPQDFWRIRWDAVLPAGTSVMARTRVSNNVTDFDPASNSQPAWSDYYSVSGFEFPTAGGDLYQYAQVEVSMSASPDFSSSPVMMRLYLDRRVSADDFSFQYSEQDQWESGKKFNVDTRSVPGSISIASLTDVDNVFYGSKGSANQTDADLVSVFSSAGTTIQKGTRQALAGEPSGFGQVSAVKRGENDTIWVADTENDRVLQIDKAGDVIFGLWGSFLKEPYDGYGTEESGPGSNTAVVAPPKTPAATTTTPATVSVPNVLYALYNPSTRLLSVVFSADLETVEDAGTTFDSSKMFLKVGAKRVYFGQDTKFSLFGIDMDKYTQWAMSTNPYIGQFTFQSHVLQATLSQADSISLSAAATMDMPSIAVGNMGEQDLVSDIPTISFVTPNLAVGSESVDNNGIRIRVNGGTYTYYRSRTISMSGLGVASGKNEVEACLVDGNNNVLDDAGASCSVSFVYDPSGDLSNEPRISISSPRQGQVVSSMPVSIVFESSNHPILPVGSCVEYSVDGGSWTQHRNTNPVQVSGLSGGEHSVSMRLIDNTGNVVNSPFSLATLEFCYGISSDSSILLTVGAGTIRGVTRAENTKNPENEVSVFVANIHICNLFCPIDIQIIPEETSQVNPSGDPTVVVAKLRSPTTTECLGVSSTPIGGTAVPQDPKEIFGSYYLDGHSVVQYSMSGDVVFSNNAPKFSDTKANSKVYLGSANKASESDVIAADAIRQRAIVTRTDLSTGKTNVIWEFASDRLVSDFQLASTGTTTISISDASCDIPSAYVRTGETVVWTNKSSMPIKIVSGTTTPAIWASDPDLTLYGDEFQSEELQPGEQYAYTFDNGGDFGWFSYPNIVTGTVGVSPAGVSQADEYLIVEKDPIPSVSSGRVSRVDSWGKIRWTFGEGILYDPKDVRLLDGSSVIIST